MKRLNNELIKGEFEFPQDIKVGNLEDMPERVIQFGEGNFLRAFVNWMIDEMNDQELFNGRAVVVQPIEQGLVETLNEQDGLYTLLLRGLQKGEVVEEKRVITSISRGINPYRDWEAFLKCAEGPEMRFMVSNTTEAGIAYVKEDKPVDRCPTSFPAKVTAFLYRRFKAFKACPDKGMIILPCELIDRNGDSLKEIVLRYADEWGLEVSFKDWIEASNYFLNTLVDRIVTGYPKDEIEKLKEQLGYEDKLIDTGEIFHLWVIEGDKELAKDLPFDKVGLNVLWTDDLTPYRTRKVRILNGAHTMTVLMAYLYGLDTVGECIDDPLVLSYMKKGIYDEIVPILDLPEDEKREFAEAVLERFANPFIEHQLLSISLNSVSKWQVRVLPSLLEYTEYKGELPQVLSFSLAALLVFYRGEGFNRSFNVQDDDEIVEFFQKLWADYDKDGDLANLCNKVLGQKGFWGMDLNNIRGITKRIEVYIQNIFDNGMKSAVEGLLEN